MGKSVDNQLYQDIKNNWERAKENRPTVEELIGLLGQFQTHLCSITDVIEDIIRREQLYHSYKNMYNGLKNEKKLKK